MNMIRKITLIALLAAVTLSGCNNTGTEADSTVTTTEASSEGSTTTVTVVTKPAQGASSEATTEVSLEGSTSEEIQGSTKPSSSSSGSTKPSGNTSTKTTEAVTKAPTTTKAAQTTTAAPKPTQVPAQPTTAAPKPTPAPTQAPTEAPVWHEPVYEIQQVWVVDKAAWTEEVTEEVQVPVYVYTDYFVCLRAGCGFETANDDEWIAHENMHMDNNEGYAYKVDTRKELTGYTTEYQTTYIEHAEEGHYENRRVLVREGYWE